MSVMTIVQLLIIYSSIDYMTAAEVSTKLGKIRGTSYVSSSGKEIYTFLGVPYGAPMTGIYRFDEPRPVKPWIGVWFAVRHAPSCIQHNTMTKTIYGKENCLYLNIYTPTITSTAKLPVLVFFHGGGFMIGESYKYRPNFLLENYDIVFVSVSYRLGPFGFLSTEDDIVSGNNGLKDQALALKWIQENISAFGGDRTKVTISGNSAGGVSVQLHYLSALSRGTFDKGISSSGSALVPWALAERPLQKAKMLADSVGCPTADSAEMVDCLKQRPSEEILANVVSLFKPWMHNPLAPFGPVIENSSSPFLSSHPYDILLRGDVYDRPLLASVTAEEGLVSVSIFIDKQEHLETLNKDWATISHHLLDFNYTVPADKVDDVTSSIKNYYLSDQDISLNTQDKLVKMVGDRLFLVDMDLAARLQASSMTSDVYFYKFAYRGERSLSELLSGSSKNFGVSHMDDMLYLMIPKPLNTPGDKAMQLQLGNMWASFMNNGRPTFLYDVWDAVSNNSRTTGSLKYLLIKSFNETERVEENDFGNKNFWNSLDINENWAICKNRIKSAKLNRRSIKDYINAHS